MLFVILHDFGGLGEAWVSVAVRVATGVLAAACVEVIVAVNVIVGAGNVAVAVGEKIGVLVTVAAQTANFCIL